MSEKYSKLWTKPFYHVLGPLPLQRLSLREQGIGYHPYTWIGIRYILFFVLEEDLPQVVQRMLDAGVPIIEPLPQETEAEALTHFWTDRLHEFALIANRPEDDISHAIYRLDPPEILFMPILASTYQLVVNRMLLAGATVLSEIPETPKA